MRFKLLKNNNIGIKIASLVAVSVLSAMIILAIILGFIQLNQSVDEKRSALESTAYIYASALADAIETHDKSGAQKILTSISRVPNILHAAAVNANGETIAAMGNITFLTSDQVSNQTSTYQLVTKGNLPVSVDIVRGGQLVGKLILLGDIRDIRSQLIWTFLTTALASIVAALLAFPISRPLQSRIAAPIVNLTNTMKKMRETRTFAQTDVGSAQGETRVLVETFNSMISDIHNRDAALRKLAYFDPLTGLPNRAKFQRILDDAFESKVESAMVFVIDIDNFHAINDAMGHSMGDALLMDIAARLYSELPEDGTIARIGGDEFAVFVPKIRTVVDAQSTLAKFIASLYAPIKILGHEIHVTGSAGVLLLPEHANTSSEVQRHLDLALHDAKDSGVGRVSFFRSEMIDSLQEEAELLKGLRIALEQNQIIAYYQPVVNLETGYVEGFEALARWIDPVKGFISPTKFIPVAEKSGLISKLGAQILKLACQQAKIWKDEGHPDWTVAVNVSAAQIMQAGFIDQVCEILDQTKVPSHLLCLELTESLFVGKSMITVKNMLQEFRVLGIKTALDDFGTGYSSLSYLEHLPFDRLKIDRAFVHGAHENSKNTELLKGIIGIAHGLGMSVVAEGAESEADLRILRNLKADHVQGYAIAKPLPSAEAKIAAENYDRKTNNKTALTA